MTRLGLKTVDGTEAELVVAEMAEMAEMVEEACFVGIAKEAEKKEGQPVFGK